MGIRPDETVREYLERLKAERSEMPVVERLRKQVSAHNELLTIDEEELKDYEKKATEKRQSWVWIPDMDKKRQPEKNIWGGPFGKYTWPTVSVLLSPCKEFGKPSLKSGDFVGGHKFVGWAKFLWSEAHSADQLAGKTRVYWEHYARDFETKKFYKGVFKTRMTDFTINLANMADGWADIKGELRRLISDKRSRDSRRRTVGTGAR